MDATSSMSFNALQCHSPSSLTVTILSCSLQLPLLDRSFSLSLSLPLPLDEPVLIDAKEDTELAPSDISADVSLQSTDAGSVLFLTSPLQAGSQVQGIFLQPIVAKRNKRACSKKIYTQCTNIGSHHGFAVQVDTVTVNLQYRQAQETFCRRRLIWTHYHLGLARSDYGPLVLL